MVGSRRVCGGLNRRRGGGLSGGLRTTGSGFLKNHLVCIVTASSKYRNANRERESLRYRENYMIYFKILQFYLNTMRVY